MERALRVQLKIVRERATSILAKVRGRMGWGRMRELRG